MHRSIKYVACAAVLGSLGVAMAAMSPALGATYALTMLTLPRTLSPTKNWMSRICIKRPAMIGTILGFTACTGTDMISGQLSGYTALMNQTLVAHEEQMHAPVALAETK